MGSSREVGSTPTWDRLLSRHSRSTRTQRTSDTVAAHQSGETTDLLVHHPDFCVGALLDANEESGTWPEIMNTDQGCQFTSAAWTSVLKKAGVRISMDGKGRWIDNVMVERLWRSLKYEDIYLREYVDLVQLEEGVGEWLRFYNHERPHQSLSYSTPWSAWDTEHMQAA